jgi:hypothetical protein
LIKDEIRTPPEVGAADANSAIDIPTHKMKKLATSHFLKSVEYKHRKTNEIDELTPQTIAGPPPLGMA